MGLKRRNGYGKGSFIKTDLIMSLAYLSLNPSAQYILILFLLKRNFKNVNYGKKKKQRHCVNCDSLTMTYKELEAEPFKFSRPRITRGIDDLLAKGFIEIKHLGGCYQQDKSVYGLVEDWRYWSSGMIIRKRNQDVRRGFQKKKSDNSTENMTIDQ